MTKPIIVPVKGDTKDYDKKVKESTKKTEKLAESAKKVGVVSGLAFAASAGFIKKSLDAYRVQELAINELNAALKNQGIFTEDLSKKYQDQASALQKLTLFGDEAIIRSQALLQTMLGEEEITEDLMKAVLDLASAKKIDLAGAADLVGKSIGSSTNALGRYGISLKAGSSKTEKMAQLTTELNSKFGGAAAAAAEGTGKMTQLGNRFGDIVEVLGKQFVPLLDTTADALNSLFDVIEENESLAIMTGTLVTATAGITALTGATSAAILIIPKMGAALTVLGGIIAGISLPFAAVATAVALVGTGTIALIEKLDKNATATNEAKNKVEEYQEALNKSIDAHRKLTNEIDYSKKMTKAQKDAIKQAGTEVETHTKKLNKWKEILQIVSVAEADLAGKVKDTKDALAKGDDTAITNQQKEFDDRLSLFLSNEELYSEEKLLKLEEQKQMEADFDIQKKAEALEREGKHNEALALLDDAQVKKKVAASKLAISNEKKFKKLKEDLDIKSSQAQISLASNTATLINTIAGKETAVGFALAKVAAVGQILLADSQARASATAAAAAASIAAPPGANLAVFSANLATYQAMIAANTGLSLGIVAAQTIQGAQAFATGGLVEGGIRGRDSVPAMLQQGELVTPRNSYDDVVNDAANRKIAEDEGLESTGQSMEVEISFNGDAVELLEAKLIERKALGIGRGI